MNSDKKRTWSVYILRCADGTLYTGIAKDVARRLEQHRRGLGAKYTRGRAPLELVFMQAADNQGEALRREYAIKSLSTSQKRRLIARYHYQCEEDNKESAEPQKRHR
jgi:predicted GIY-YIG superfamily endonuclease